MQEDNPTGGHVPSERLDESEVYRSLLVQEPTWRERTASRVAYAILVLFGVSLAVSFAFGFYVLACSPTRPPDDKVVEASLAYVKVTGGMFTPLLAFILGFYFTRKEE